MLNKLIKHTHTKLPCTNHTVKRRYHDNKHKLTNMSARLVHSARTNGIGRTFHLLTFLNNDRTEPTHNQVKIVPRISQQLSLYRKIDACPRSTKQEAQDITNVQKKGFSLYWKMHMSAAPTLLGSTYSALLSRIGPQ